MKLLAAVGNCLLFTVLFAVTSQRTKFTVVLGQQEWGGPVLYSIKTGDKTMCMACGPSWLPCQPAAVNCFLLSLQNKCAVL
jgi:hypothetical protein